MMNILCSTDNNYVPYCGIMLTSLFENNRGETICVFIMTEGLSEANREVLKETVWKYNGKVEFINVDKDSFKDCPINPEKDHVSLASYYRLAVARFLPKEVDRILYLDCDMIVNEPLNELYSTDIDGIACAVVADEAYMLPVHYNRLGLKLNTAKPYFNAGMLLINVDYWRRHDIETQFFAYIVDNAPRLAFHDQDTLNAVLSGQVKYLPLSFNLQTGFIVKAVINNYDECLKKEIIKNALSSVIVHYTGPSKPWVKKFRHPFVKHFLYYRSISMFSKTPKLLSPKENLYDKFMYLRNRIIWGLGIIKRPWAYVIPEQPVK